jgi:hypothetical protein
MKEKLIIMPDYGSAYVWRNGGCLIFAGRFNEDDWEFTPYKVSKKLQKRFKIWQDAFEFNAYDNTLNWDQFHRIGRKLTDQLRIEIGHLVDIEYQKPIEDPEVWTEYESWLENTSEGMGMQVWMEGLERNWQKQTKDW